jgi:hypothetical protein
MFLNKYFMQIIPRYLVNNRITIVANEAGFVTEYRPVYSRQLKVFKNIDNILEFRVLNADQKPVNIGNYTPKFQAFDENKNLIIEHDGVAITSDDSAAIRGLFKVTITESDLLNVQSQYLSYAIHLVDSNGDNVLTYTDTHFGGSGTIYVDAKQYPAPKTSTSVTTFLPDNDSWYSSAIDAQPGINGNEALHTAAIYTNEYVGDIVIQATLDNVVTDSTSWADISTLSFTGSETEPTPANFNGVYNHIRFKTTASPADTITKILVRN